MKILLIRNDNIGDLVCSTPAIEALRKKYPKAQIDIVVNSLNAPVVIGNPFLDKVWVYTKTKHTKNFFLKIKAFLHKGWILWRIFRESYDVSVILRVYHSKHAGLFARAARRLKFAGVAYHIYHDENPRDMLEVNHNIYLETIRKKKIQW